MMYRISMVDRFINTYFTTSSFIDRINYLFTFPVDVVCYITVLMSWFRIRSRFINRRCIRNVV